MLKIGIGGKEMGLEEKDVVFLKVGRLRITEE